MTPAAWIAIAGVIVTLALNGAVWIYGLGRQAAATKATEDEVTALQGRVGALEANMEKVAAIKVQLESHAQLTAAQFEAIRQQMRDGFALVASEQRSFDRLVSTQLDEIKNRLREPAG